MALFNFSQRADEQMEAAVRDIVTTITRYYNGLRQSGVDGYDALQLTMAFQDSLIRGGLERGQREQTNE